jgi:heat shock protein HtpX
MFAIIYALVTLVGELVGIGNFLFYGGLAAFIILLQFWLGPILVSWSLRVCYVSPEEDPQLHSMVAELAEAARIPKPRVGISRIFIPNAFAFGRWRGDARVCVTQSLLNLLSREELKAVLAHEISHIKHRDMAIITLLSVVPLICWVIFNFVSESDEGWSLALVALLFYFITNLLVLYGSRIREYYADLGAVKTGIPPHRLASALYKLVHGAARMDKKSLREREGLKAFFASDPSRARREITALKEIDQDMSGTIDPFELLEVRTRVVQLSTIDRVMELMSTHPNMLKRIKHLASLVEGY